MPSHEDRLRVYLACQPIFSGENAQLRKGKKVKQLIRENKSPLELTLQTIKEKKMFEFVQSLLDKRVFESDLTARLNSQISSTPRHIEMLIARLPSLRPLKQLTRLWVRWHLRGRTWTRPHPSAAMAPVWNKRM